MKEFVISEKSVLKLTKQMFEFVCKIAHYESPRDVKIAVIDENPTTNGSGVYREPRYMASVLVINIADANTYDGIVEVISHEIAHIMLNEYFELYDTWNDTGEDAQEEPQYKGFVRADERSAMRIGRIIQHLWNIRGGK